MIIVDGKHTRAKIMIDNVDESCMKQIVQFVNNEAFTRPVAIMPDCHAGRGSVIGFTMPLTEKVIPATIGVDIGCGMFAVNLGPGVPEIDHLDKLDAYVRKHIPLGTSVNKQAKADIGNVIHAANATMAVFRRHYNDRFGTNYGPPNYTPQWLDQKCKAVGITWERMLNSLGTLGGGNHFIEFGRDTSGNVWFTIHSGSRQFGLKIAEHHQRLAGSSDLDWLSGDAAFGYLTDMVFAQAYAAENRRAIASAILDYSELFQVDNWIETVHNYIDFRDMVVRKGAISSYTGEPMVIPFNMRDGIALCEGKSNPEWNYSAPHGAGRILSRSQAKKQLSLEEFKSQMGSVFSTSVSEHTLDEAPGAYKDYQTILDAIESTATVIDRIVPFYNLKA